MIAITYQTLTTKLILPLVFSLMVGGCLGKSHLPKPHEGPFDGQVIDSLTDEAIPGVALEIGGQVLVTDSEGKFYLSNLAPGDYQVTLSRDWYKIATGTLHYVGRPGGVTFTLEVAEALDGRIWYSSSLPGKRDIFCLDLATRQIDQIKLPNSGETNPVVLSSSQVIFQSDRNSDTSKDELFIYDLGFRTLTPLCPDPQDDQHPAVDESGTKLVFQSTRSGYRAIFMSSLEEPGKVEELARGQNPVLDFSGQRVAYIDGSYRLNIFTSGGSNELVASPGSDSKCNNPCWSPDGQHIALEVWSGTNGRHSIFLYNIDSRTWQQVTFNNGNRNEGHRHPCWSSDGELLFFGATILYSSRVDIYCIRLQDAISQGAAAKWLMVSKGPGSKDYPSWGE